MASGCKFMDLNESKVYNKKRLCKPHYLQNLIIASYAE